LILLKIIRGCRNASVSEIDLPRLLAQRAGLLAVAFLVAGSCQDGWRRAKEPPE
jgi:hypothetical protein